MKMDTKNFSAFTLFVLLSLAHIGEGAYVSVVAKSGVDIKEALLNAWKSACEATTGGTIVIPKGTFPMSTVLLAGPCKGPVELQIQATLKAPSDPNAIEAGKEWLTIQYVDKFTLSGGGFLDGQGAVAWTQNDCKKTGACDKLPNNLSLNFLNNSVIRDITSSDSKLFHINALGAKNLTFEKLNIKAPRTSHNTNGIHIAKSTEVNVKDTMIGTGGDCISIGDGTTNLHITGVVCGPGHGISVGSLGRSPGEEPVKGVFVQDSKFIGTVNGVRIKTWPSNNPGVVTDIHYDNIEMQNVKHPIVIDQEYCPHNQCSKESPSKVKISQVSFKNIKGTSGTENAVVLGCSSGAPCEGIEFGDINLTYHGGAAKSVCANVKPTFAGTQNPPLCAAAGDAKAAAS